MLHHLVAAALAHVGETLHNTSPTPALKKPSPHQVTMTSTPTDKLNSRVTRMHAHGRLRIKFGTATSR